MLTHKNKSLENQEWVDISFANQYEISRNGIVRSKGRWANVESGKPSFYLMGKVLNHVVKKTGYCSICLFINSKKTYHLVHRLVAMSFIPNPLNYSQVNHKNGVKHDNRVENLEWCTPKENISHMLKNGMREAPKGENHFNVRISDEDALRAIEMYQSGNYLMKDIASMFNVHRRTIGDIINKKTRKYLHETS